jgi:trehalose 6-phosphate phosphatase
MSRSELTAPFRAAPDRAAVLVDFDGTVSNIVLDAADARPAPGAVDVLHRLADRYGVVAVVSGRPVSFLVEHLGAEGRPGRLVLSGLYGLERSSPDGDVTVIPGADRWRSLVEKAATAAESQLAPDVAVERKGLTVTLHVRPHPERAAEVASWAQSEADRTGLVLHPARMSFELRPPVRADKGTVVYQLAHGLNPVCFIGDDLGDLPAFDVLDKWRRAGADVVKVAVRSDEAPAELLERSDLQVEGPAGVLDFLQALLD